MGILFLGLLIILAGCVFAILSTFTDYLDNHLERAFNHKGYVTWDEDQS